MGEREKEKKEQGGRERKGRKEKEGRERRKGDRGRTVFTVHWVLYRRKFIA